MAGTGKAHLRDSPTPVLRVEDLVVEYATKGQLPVQAVSGVSLEVHSGETLAIIGESGCGKSTLGKGILQLVETQSGSVVFDGVDITKISKEQLRQTTSLARRS